MRTEQPADTDGRGPVMVAVIVAASLIVGLAAIPVMVILGATQPSPAAACTDGTATDATIDDAAASDGSSWEGLSDRQREIAGILIQAGQAKGVTTNGILAALMAGYQESKYQVYANDGLGGDLEADQAGISRSLGLPHDAVGTDHGSLGVLQQQWPWWGTMRQLMDPETSAYLFYDSMVDKVPNYQRHEPGDVAQTVQVSAYPDAYDQWEPLARQLLAHADELGGQLTNPPNQPDPQALDANTVSSLCGPGDAMDCPATGLPVENGLTPDALRVLRCVDHEFGPLDYLGIGQRATNPDSDHPTGRAVDILIDHWSTDDGNTQGWRIARWVVDHASRLGVKYVIFDRQIWSVDQTGWRPYSHPSGADDPTSEHRDHVHVSVYGNAAGSEDPTGGGWQRPVRADYVITATFGQCSTLWSDCHTGTDLAAGEHTPIYAAHSGSVTSVGYDPDGYGNYLVITSGPVDVWYAHQCDGCIRVREGHTVQTGERIGGIGQTGNTTGPHLHFEIRVHDQAIDPQPYMSARGVQL
jgi:hypothetical protein